jgi:DNA primase
VKLRFAGTRGEIEARTARHRRHSCLLVAYRGRELMLDCGLDWRGRLGRFRPVAVPLDWDEVGARFEPRRFTVRNLQRRLARGDDPWAGMQRHAPSLTGAKRQLEGCEARA